MDLEGGRRALRDIHGRMVGLLDRSVILPEGMHCIEARVAAIMDRCREYEDPVFQERVLCDRGEVVLSELVMETAE